MIATLLLLLVGAAIGGVALLTVFGLWATSDDGRRRLAVARAEARVRDAQAEALNRMADVVAGAVFETTSGQPASGWPSEAVVDVELVHHERGT